jgi:hypothetical protein
VGRLFVVLVVVSIVGLVDTGCGSSGAVDMTLTNTPADVTVTSCRPDANGMAGATVVITNHGSKTANYIVEVTMTPTQRGALASGATVDVNDLGVGRRSKVLDATSDQLALPAGYTCRVTEATRQDAS